MSTVRAAVFGSGSGLAPSWARWTPSNFTTALRFSGQPAAYPRSPVAITLAAAQAGLLTAQREVFFNPAPPIPATNEPVPLQ